MLMISILCLETSCSEGPWPNDSRGVGWVSMSSRTTVAVLTLVSDNKKVDFEWVCVYPSASSSQAKELLAGISRHCSKRNSEKHDWNKASIESIMILWEKCLSVFLLLSFSIVLVLTFTISLIFLSSFPVHFPADPSSHQYHKQRESSVHGDAEYSSTSKIILCNAHLFLWDQKIKTSAARHKWSSTMLAYTQRKSIVYSSEKKSLKPTI